MKKLISTIAIAALALSFSITAQAGSVPEDMFSDHALLFFGEVVSYDAEAGTITVLPTQKIKGDVEIGVERTFKRGIFDWNKEFASEDDTSDFPVQGEVYLMSYFDANNPLNVFRVTNTDTKTLEMKGIDHANMWGRMQTYINDGTYEQKEAERLERIAAQNTNPALSSATVPETEQPAPENILKPTNYWLYGAVGASIAVIAVCLVVYLRKKKKTGDPYLQ